MRTWGKARRLGGRPWCRLLPTLMAGRACSAGCLTRVALLRQRFLNRLLTQVLMMQPPALQW